MLPTLPPSYDPGTLPMPATNAPTTAQLHAQRVTDLRARGFGILATLPTTRPASTGVYMDAPRTHPLRRALRLLAVLAVSTAVWWGATTDGATAAPATPVCYEDQPCWEWSTMGGLVRGVILRTAPRDCRWSYGYSPRCFTVVDATLYCQLRRIDMIDTRRTRSLKGDRIARDHGCDDTYFAQ